MNTRKFLYELNDFSDVPADVLAHETDDQQEQPAQNEPEPQFYTEKELEEERKKSYKQGFEEGHDEGLQKAQQEISAHQNKILEDIKMNLNQVSEQWDRLCTQAGEFVAATLAASLQSVFPALARQYGADEIRRVCADAISSQRDAKSLRLRLNEDDYEKIKSELDAMAKDSGIAWEIETLADRPPGTCQIDWPQGGLLRDWETTQKQIIDRLWCVSGQEQGNTSKQFKDGSDAGTQEEQNHTQTETEDVGEPV